MPSQTTPRPRPKVIAMLLAIALVLFGHDSPLQAQTTEIQRQVETRLWFQRWLVRLQDGELLPVAFTIAIVLALAAMGWGLWRWRRSRARVY